MHRKAATKRELLLGLRYRAGPHGHVNRWRVGLGSTVRPDMTAWIAAIVIDGLTEGAVTGDVKRSSGLLTDWTEAMRHRWSAKPTPNAPRVPVNQRLYFVGINSEVPLRHFSAIHPRRRRLFRWPGKRVDCGPHADGLARSAGEATGGEVTPSYTHGNGSGSKALDRV